MTRTTRLSATVVGALLMASPEAAAYRPFDGTDAAVAGVGEFELELGPAHFYGRGRNNYLIAPATVLNLGLVKDLELVVDFKQFVALQQVPTESQVRLLDTDILLKKVLRRGSLQDADGASVAIEGGFLTPEIQGDRSFGAQADVITSYRWCGQRVHFNEQAAFSRSQNLDLFSSIILEGPDDLLVRPVAEVYVEHEFGKGSRYSGLVGAIWTASESFTLDLGLRVARIDAQRVAEVRLGFTWALPIVSESQRTVENAWLSRRHGHRSL